MLFLMGRFRKREEDPTHRAIQWACWDPLPGLLSKRLLFSILVKEVGKGLKIKSNISIYKPFNLGQVTLFECENYLLKNQNENLSTHMITIRI